MEGQHPPGPQPVYQVTGEGKEEFTRLEIRDRIRSGEILPHTELALRHRDVHLFEEIHPQTAGRSRPMTSASRLPVLPRSLLDGDGPLVDAVELPPLEEDQNMRFPAFVVTCLALALVMIPAHAAEKPKATTDMAHIWTAGVGDWMPLPDIFPPGGFFKVMHGNPATGPADMFFRFPAGYGVPWHFHTPTERLMMQEGTMRFEMKHGTQDMSAGSFMFVPPRSPHAAKCVSYTDCYFYLSSNAPFDIHLIDDKWNVTRSWPAPAASPASK